MRSFLWLPPLFVAASFSLAAVAAEQPDRTAAISAGQCWVNAPIKPRPLHEKVEVVLQESSLRYSVAPAQLREGVQQVVTREGVKTYRVVPATFKQVSEQVEVKPEFQRTVVVPAVYEAREAVLTVEQAKTVLEPCQAAGTRYGNSGAMAFCATEIPAREETVMVNVLVEPETTRVITEPAVYETVTRWVVDQPARVVEVDTAPQLATVPVVETVSPEKVLERTEPAVIRTMNITKYQGEPQIALRRAVCDSDLHPALISRLQSALSSKGYSLGNIDSHLGQRTIAALSDYQADNGLAIGAVTYESLELLGVR
ncbi:peptidoglycan-binding domain-containing protein [Pseudomonas sp. FME51]|uniref:peptidoglycan-binding domain-containing protein n=1 Tax=Pseudomonas sp. FME51 TaxID=2742609 RepID=UPI0018679C54|nr:peptidoglycan-binding domain-containing protein [Pseudomonas sp. FME51]